MNLERHLRAQRKLGRKLLVPYVTGGLGSSWLDVVRAVADAGADAIEIGIPFSDPVMDGPILQEAARRAIDIGATPAAIFDALLSVEVEVPLVAMTYYNLVQHFGHRRFADAMASVGVDGIIIPDLPLEDAVGPESSGATSEWGAAAAGRGIETVLLAAPTTPADRLAEICAASRGFVYGISVLGVTGERSALSPHALEMGSRLKSTTDRPVLLGVGLSTPEQAVAASAVGDGVIVGSALARRLLEGGGPSEASSLVAAFRRGLDDAAS